MQTSRRTFIKQSSFALAAAALASNKILASEKISDRFIGIQLYTVRDDMAKDPVSTLKKIALMGYKYVEHAGYEKRKFYNYSPDDFKKIINANGLTMLSGHSFLGAEAWNKSTNDFTDEWKYTFEDAAKAGMKYVISPGLDENLCKTEDDFKWYMQLFNKSGELAKKSGIQFAFHNESYEFNHSFNNVRLYDILLKSVDRNLVAQQIDIGNMYATGGRALEYLKHYPGSFFSMHVKDEMASSAHEGGYESTLLGAGVVGVKDILNYTVQHGSAKLLIIEQESYQDKTPLQCAKQDLAILKQWGF